MNSTADTLWAIKTVAVSAAVLPTSSYVVPMWGVGPASFVLGAIGAAMSYGWELGTPRGKAKDTGLVLVVKSILVTLFAVALVVVVPDIFDWDLKPSTEPPLTFIIALYGRHIYPALRSAIPSIVRGLGSALGSRGGGYSEQPPIDDPRKPGVGTPPDDDQRGY